MTDIETCAKTRTKLVVDWTLIVIIAIMLMTFFFMFDTTTAYSGGGTPENDGYSMFQHVWWDSYTVQAVAWLHGKTNVDDYAYKGSLELAIYNDHYYVSFPPFPSVVMLPFAALFGYDVPSNLIIMLLCVLVAVFAYKTLITVGTQKEWAAFLTLFYVFGSNVMFMSMNGGVWFMAQVMALMFNTAAFYCMLKNRRAVSYLLVAFAVGCRPFSFLMFFVLLIFYCMNDMKEKNVKLIPAVLTQWKAWILPAAVGVMYMAYNLARFDNPLEFGHNWLPEFTESEHGQFSLTYFVDNFYKLVLLPVKLDKNLHTVYPWFNGFMFYIANPIFLIVMYRAIKNLITRKVSARRVIMIVAMLLNLVFLCCHKTLGGWQFGARYTVDMLPFALLYILMDTPKNKLSEQSELLGAPCTAWRFNRVDLMIAVFGILFNMSGAIKFWASYAG